MEIAERLEKLKEERRGNLIVSSFACYLFRDMKNGFTFLLFNEFLIIGGCNLPSSVG